MGLIVDEVCEVLDLSSENFEDPPAIGTGQSAAFIQGMGKLKEKVIILLDIDKVLSTGDAEVLGQIADEVQELETVAQ